MESNHFYWNTKVDNMSPYLTGSLDDSKIHPGFLGRARQESFELESHEPASILPVLKRPRARSADHEGGLSALRAWESNKQRGIFVKQALQATTGQARQSRSRERSASTFEDYQKSKQHGFEHAQGIRGIEALALDLRDREAAKEQASPEPQPFVELSARRALRALDENIRALEELLVWAVNQQNQIMHQTQPDEPAVIRTFDEARLWALDHEERLNQENPIRLRTLRREPEEERFIEDLRARARDREESQEEQAPSEPQGLGSGARRVSRDANGKRTIRKRHRTQRRETEEVQAILEARAWAIGKGFEIGWEGGMTDENESDDEIGRDIHK